MNRISIFCVLTPYMWNNVFTFYVIGRGIDPEHIPLISLEGLKNKLGLEIPCVHSITMRNFLHKQNESKVKVK